MRSSRRVSGRLAWAQWRNRGPTLYHRHDCCFGGASGALLKLGKEQSLRIGVPKETKVHEYRVGLTPASVREVVRRGHSVAVQEGAGVHIGLTDADYQRAGARILPTAVEVFAESELIVKVKEPQPHEFVLLRAGQTLFTYLHLAAAPALTHALLESGVTAIAYETVTGPRGGLPLLAPMSEIAGRLAVQAGAHCLEMAQGGRGVLLSGATGVPGAKVAVLGGELQAETR